MYMWFHRQAHEKTGKLNFKNAQDDSPDAVDMMRSSEAEKDYTLKASIFRELLSVGSNTTSGRTRRVYKHRTPLVRI
jgi:hypothetical protein